MERDQLPDGWVWTALGKACDVNPRMSWPEQLAPESLVSFVPMAAVDDVTGAIIAAEPRPIGEVWRGYKRFAEGDVIFARITPCMENGKAAVAAGLLNGIGLGSTEFHVLRPTGSILAEWVHHFVRQQSFRNEAAREMTGTAGQLRVPRSFVEEATIPLPPLPEQQRIVARIEALFRESRRTREALDCIPPLLARFRQSVLAAAFRGDLTERDPHDEPASVLLARVRAERRCQWEEDLRARGKDPGRYKYKEPAVPDASDLPELPEGWAWATWEQLSPRVTVGHVGKMKDEYVERGVPFLRSQNVRENRFDPTGLVYVSPEFHAKLAKSTLKPGDLVVVRSGSVGVTCVIPESLEEANCSDLVIIRKPFGVVPEYGSYYMNSMARRYVLAGQVGVALTHFNTKSVASLPIAVSPLAKQHRIVARIEALFAQADVIEAAVRVAQRRVEQLEQAVLARAFRGELVA